MDKLDSLLAETSIKYKIEYRDDLPSKLGGLCQGSTILLNSRKSRQEQLQNLAEEVAHQESTVGDILDQKNLQDVKQENKARGLAYERLVNLNDLIALQQYATNEFELADLLDVTPKFLNKAIEHYRIKRGNIFTYKGMLINLTNGIQILSA
ncbi:ImmA/IrrE family metallo-endopeptidase [Latilactobacillus curvatus]|uniref:ImmA/IrrE family metallo-endopeptidase n=1 Tax=Latilactobacillus curvatus TaxID=28038 RepID=UPI0020C7E65E|nr:ImmA/IrrE family metallo-endopeptidase [Latilactobacillus curvatus]MCP8858898.1 ImmA/IrrE family metallo-endopeptidase [Latilactobacillus curvatus]